MSVRRPAASLLLAAAALALTACSSGGTTTAAGSSATPAATVAASASASASAGATASTGAGTGAGTGTATAKPTAGSTAKPSAKPVPAGDCTAAAQRPGGHKVISATVAWGGPDRIGAAPTRFVCGKDVPGEGYWEATTGDDTYFFAPGATAELLVGTQAKAVPVARALQQVVACTTDNKASQGEYGCYGNLYEITLDGAGKITRIAAMYRA
ncbi:hypothetical protein ACGFX4_13420 [Kitasatospora sp. NPDC048365]|uniref:hypothetical protein n=1 Tax=Kitasatospora sp. NPDC048365 TaxID=3364050 RepID=UPI003717C6A7